MSDKKRWKMSDRSRAMLDAFTRSTFQRNRAAAPRSVALDPTRLREFEFSTGVPAGLKMLVSTMSGIFLLDTTERSATQLTEGKSYGITKDRNRWLFTWCDTRGLKKSNHTSHIFSAELEDSGLTDLRLIATGLPNELHQIDVFQGRLWVPHTGYNQVLSIPTERLYRSTPNRLWNFDVHSLEIESPSHLNSIYFDAHSERILVVAHNHTRQTKRASDILVCDRSLRLVEKITTKGHSVHNVCMLRDGILFCDSGNCKLMLGEEPLHSADRMPRGMSVTDDYLVIGGSDVCFNRSKRFSTNAAVYVLDYSGGMLGRIDMPETGDVYEIRQFGCRDFSLSAASPPMRAAIGKL